MRLLARITAVGLVTIFMVLVMTTFIVNVSHMHYGFGLHALNAVLGVFSVSAFAGFAVGRRVAQRNEQQ